MPDKIFSLEILNAFHGDCLLLHYGTTAQPRILLVDGGPNGTFDRSLKPRLEELAAQRQKPLKLDHVMVTHLDDDHINGVLQMVEEIERGSDLVTARSFWFNTFDDALSKAPPELAQASLEVGTAGRGAVLAAVEKASINQGRSLRDALVRLNAKQNDGRGILFAEGQGMVLKMSGLDVTLICPDEQHLTDLAKKWIGSPAKKVEAAAYVDRSVFNLSSLVVVVSPGDQAKGPRVLLTGDARGDHILAGLEHAQLFAGGKTHFDVLKVPHHGSDRNLSLAFFQSVTADYYVISGNGRDGNPSLEVMRWIAQTAKKNAKICLTFDHNPQYPELKNTFETVLKAEPDLAHQLWVRHPQQKSICIDLLAAVP